MSNAIAVPGLGTVRPDGTSAYRVVQPVTVAQLRALAREDWCHAMTVTERGGVPQFRALCSIKGRQVTVTGRIRGSH